MNTIWKITVFFSYLLTLIFGDSPLHERYHTYEEIQTQLEEWNDEFGDSVNIYPGSGIIYHLEELGISTEDGLPFWAVKLSYNADIEEDEPKFLFLGQCHAEEIYGVEITMELINKFLHPSPQYHLQNMQAILQSSEVWVVPTYNPEGLTVVHGDSVSGDWLQDVSYRKNKRDVNLNGVFDFDNTAEAGNDSDGVDLNRNYDFNWIFGDGAWEEDYGSGNYQSHFDYYRGESPFSESETQAIRNFALDNQFLLSIAYHSSRSGNVSEQIIFPWMWDGGKSSPDYPVISSLATGISNLIPTETGLAPANYTPVASVSRKGNAHDWFYTETGCIQFLIETGTANMQPDSLELIEDTIERNLEGALHLMNRGIGYFIGDFAADAYQLTGIVTDASNGNPIDSAIIKISEMDGPMLKPRVTDQFGRYRRLLTNGTFALSVSARGYESQSFSTTPSSTSQTVQDISLIPLETHSLELNIATPSDYSESVQLLLTDQYKTDTLQISNGSFNDQIPENHYTIKIIGENLFPYFNEIDLTANTPLTIDMSWAGELFNEPFSNLSNWSIESGEWHVDNGVLISQSDLIYPNSLNSILSSWINNPDHQSLALSLDFQYEMEWENDTAYVAILGNEDTTVFHWTDQNWQYHTECLSFVTNSDSFRIQIGIIPDNTVEYRGIEIRKITILFKNESGQINIAYSQDWNLVGLPVEVEDPYYQTIFPTSVENTLYSFDVIYNLDSTLVPGRGYWLKFEEEGSTIITGNIIDEITLTLDEGWNLVSGPGNIVSIYSVTDPDGIIIPGTLYGFEYNYIPSEEFIPGKSYWLKTFQAGEVTLTSGMVSQASHKNYNLKGKENTLTINGIELYFGIELTDRERMSYSLPPKPPMGAFDARFTGDWKYCGDLGEIEVMNNSQHLTLSYDIVIPLETQYKWVLTSEESESYILDGSGEIEVNSSDRFTLIKELISVPKTFILYQNYPNPFNPSTTIKYNLSIRSHVQLTIYDLTGKEVMKLVNEYKNSGRHEVKWNGSRISSGIYFYVLDTPSNKLVKKLVFIK